MRGWLSIDSVTDSRTKTDLFTWLLVSLCTSHIPKLRLQTCLSENLCNLFHASPMILQGHAIPIPASGKPPHLLNGQHLSAFEVVSFAPLVNPFFRLEEQHGRSGEDQVIVPAGEGQGEVNE